MPYFNSFPFGMFGGFMPLITLLVIWSVAWKGWALWRAARAGSKGWFIAFLLINTAGILEIIYLFAISKPSALVTLKEKTKDL